MTELFDVNLTDLMYLKKFQKNAPKQFTKAAANLLNSFAFGTMAENKRILQSKTTVRDQNFFKRSFKVEKARGRSFNNLESKTGSIRRNRFSGWEEQETGTASNKTRTNTLLSRRGNVQNKQMPSTRLKTSNRFLHPDDFQFPGVKNKNVPFIAMLKKRKHKKPFKLLRKGKTAAGIYRLRYGKVRQLQKFGTKKIKPQRIAWMSGGRKAYFQKTNIRDVWVESIKRVLKFK